MKKWCSLILFLACVCGLATAHADMQAVEAAFAADSWAGYSPVVVDNCTLDGEDAPHAAVIMQRGGRNILCILTRQPDGSLGLDTMTAAAVYQGDKLPTLDLRWDSEGGSMRFVIITFESGRYDDLERYEANDVNGIWYLNDIELFNDQSYAVRHRTHITIFEYLHFVEENLRDGVTIWMGAPQRVFARIHRKLPHFSIEDYARNYGEAMEKLGGLPALAEGEQQDPLPAGDDAQRTAVSAPVAVLSGPMAQYAPAQGDITPDDTVLPLALEGNYALVAYGPAERTRYGYIPLNLLPAVPAVAEARFAYLDATLLADADILNAPDGERVASAVPGENVIYLGTLGADWSYIELRGDTPARGFVRSEALSVSYCVYDGISITTAYVIMDAEIIDDPYRRATPTVLGAISRGDIVMFLDNLYGEWAYIEATAADGSRVRGFVPYRAVESTEGVGLEGNG